MDRFNKKFRLEIQARNTDEFVVVESPFTLDLSITKNSMMGANMATFQIYNLNESSREKIRKDGIKVDYRPLVKLYSGYGNDLVETYVGTIKDCSSTKSGNNIITTINAFDNGEAFRSESEKNYKKETPKSVVVNDLVNDLKKFGVEPSYIGQTTGKLQRGNSFNGKTIDILNQITSGRFFIENMKSYVLDDFEVLPSVIRTFDADSGLIGTPRREQSYLYFDIFFEPRIKMGQEVNLKSKINPYLNGPIKIISIQHSGTISGSVASDVTTTLGAFIMGGTNLYKRVVI